MRICMISSTPFPPEEGIGFYVWNLARYLTKLGHEVKLITRGSARATQKEIVDGISIWRPPFFPVYPFHVHLHGIFVDKLISELESEVDLFHLHTPLVKRPKTETPFLVTVHTPMKADAEAVTTDNFLGWLIKMQAPISIQLEQRLFEQAGRLTSVASSVANELKAYGINPEIVNVLGNGVDTDMFFPNGHTPNSAEPYALTVARLAPRKGLADLINCAAHVVKVDPNFRFKIAGSGPMEDGLRADIERLGLQDNVMLLGHVSDRAQLIDLYRKATMFVHPAHYEGLPTVLLEAMACGCPAVTTAVSGALDVVTDGENGLLVPPKAPEKMGNAIIQLLQNPSLASQLRVAAQQTIQERYAWHVVSRNYVAQYQALLAGKMS